MDGYIDFRGEMKETLDDIIYIKYIGSEEVTFKTVESRLKNVNIFILKMASIR